MEHNDLAKEASIHLNIIEASIHLNIIDASIHLNIIEVCPP